MEPKRQKTQRNRVGKFFLGLFALYLILIVGFYYLAGEQLHFRQSRGNLKMPTAKNGTIELTQNTSVEQTFRTKIQRLRSVSVQWGTYYRPNAGMVTMELQDTRDDSILMRRNFDAAAITENQQLTMSVEEPIENVYDVPLRLVLFSDSVSGSAVTPLMSSSKELEYGTLRLNGAEVSGVLCFSVQGEDYIWTGLHYWKFAAGFGFLMCTVCAITWERYQKGKHSYVVNALVAVQKYRFLIVQLVSRDFKKKYKRSVLGVFWSFLNPLLTMAVQYFVFSTVFKNDIQNFAVYLLVGVVSFNFFNEACGMALTSITGNASLITKVYVPKYIYPLTRVISSVINLAISLIPLILVVLITGSPLKKSVILALYFLLCLVIFSLGVGLLLSALMVFFRDIQFLWSVLSMIWMYATPIFYPESILAPEYQFVLKINPLYYFLQNTRMCILDGISPEPFSYFQCMAIAAGMLLAGAAVFYKMQDKFVLYL